MCSYACSANDVDKKTMQEYAGITGQDIAWELIKISMFSVAKTCIIMMQVGCEAHTDTHAHADSDTHTCAHINFITGGG